MGHQTGPLAVCMSLMWMRRLPAQENSFQQWGQGRPEDNTRPGKRPKVLLVLQMDDDAQLITMVSLDVHSQSRLTLRGFVAVGAPIWATIVMDVSDVRA